MGEALPETELAKASPGNQYTGPVGSTDQSSPTLAGIGISKDQSSRFQNLADVPEDTFETVIEAHTKAEEPISAAAVRRGYHTRGPRF